MKHARFVLALIILTYLSVGALYASKTPDWQVPDEPAHFNYIRHTSDYGSFPVLEMGDYDQDYLGRLTGERFPPELSVEAVEYEDHQPPLYYVLATPVYRLFDGALAPLRLFSVLLGAGVVFLAYSIARAIFSDRPFIALGTAAFVAFLPQHVSMMAGVNNDSLAELLIGMALWITLYRIRREKQGIRDDRSLVWLGVVLGLGLVTKTTFVSIAAAIVVILLFAWWRSADRAWGRLARTLTLVLGPALLIAAPWWLRNISVYGGLDIYGLIRHDAVVVGQPRTLDWIQEHGLGEWLYRGATFTFQSFWGQFGWMGVLMPTWLYRALLLWSGLLAAGFLLWLRNTKEDVQQPARNVQCLFMAVSALLVLLAFLYYNRTFVQHQGRYLFPALIPIALGATLATDALARSIRWLDRLRPLIFAAPYLAMVALDLYALWRLILPALA